MHLYLHNKYKATTKVNDLMENSNELLKKLHDELKEYRGSFKEIAERHNCHREWVRMVLSGRYNDDALLIVATAVLKERKKSRERVNTLISETLTA